MKKFKAIVCIILVALLLGGAIFSVVFFVGEEDKKRIVVSSFPIYDICREVLGSDDDIKLLQDNGVDAHSYQPTSKDILALSKAELFVFIGGESDGWVDDIVSSANNENISTLCLIDCVDKLEEQYDNIIHGSHNHGHTHEHDEEHGDDCYDEHIWLSLKNMIKMTESILDELIKIFPEDEVKLTNNAESYINRLVELDIRYASVCNNVTTTIVLADKFPLLYLAHDYDINFLAAYHGCSSDTKASVSIISKLIEKVNEEELNYICVLENNNISIANSVVNDSGCRRGVEILEFNSLQSITNKKLSSTNYLDVMENNLNVLRMALNNEDI